MMSWVLLLTPSHGRGGGIERYAEGLEWAFSAEGIEYRRLDLRKPGIAGQAQLLAEARREIRRHSAPVRIVVVHKSLLPLAWLLARGGNRCDIAVIAHGSEVWSTRSRARSSVEQRLMGAPRTRAVAVSSFTAGVLADTTQATVLPPGLSKEWFDVLAGASGTCREEADGEVNIVTAFRLAQWRGKGLPELLKAVSALGRSDVRITICGSGEASRELQQVLSLQERCSLLPGLNDRELAQQLAAADLFVLGTRTRGGRFPSGEGFGLVLLEAQIAGTAVVVPAYGGSHDAYIDGITGMAPTDESAESLTAVLRKMMEDPVQLDKMGSQAAEWARECFNPERYAALVVSRLLS